jgi:MFS family permease
MVISLYISELSLPDIRGGLVVLQQLSITIGILASFWINYGTHYIGGIRCAPDIPYTGGTSDAPLFDPYSDIGPDGCTGQSEASWRIPLALQIAPGLILGIGMFFYPDTPRWLLAQEREGEAFKTLSRLRALPLDHPDIVAEVLDIKASILLENSFVQEHYPGLSGVKLHAAQV